VEGTVPELDELAAVVTDTDGVALVDSEGDEDREALMLPVLQIVEEIVLSTENDGLFEGSWVIVGEAVAVTQTLAVEDTETVKDVVAEKVLIKSVAELLALPDAVRVTITVKVGEADNEPKVVAEEDVVEDTESVALSVAEPVEYAVSVACALADCSAEKVKTAVALDVVLSVL
jgi:hypothetical protein